MRVGPVLAAMAALVLSATAGGQALSQGAVTVAIDVDVTGNDARTVATVDNCARIDSNGTNRMEIDVVLPAPGVPADVGIKAWQFDLTYDESVVTVTNENREFLLAAAEGSNLSIRLSDALPDSDGRFTSAGADMGQAYRIEPDGVQEVGPGVIVRITLTGVARGSTPLILSKIKLLKAGLAAPPMPISTVLNAAVSVDTPCTEPPPPTVLPGDSSPGPSETPESAGGTPGTGTPQPGAPAAGETPQPGAPGAAETPQPGTAGAAGTPQPGTPGADTQADGPPGSRVGDQTPEPGTPGPGTPVLGGTPVTGDEGDAGGEAAAEGESDGGGLSAAAWAGIAAGIAAAAVAASGAGWFALRRRRARGTPTSGGEAGSE